MSTQRVGMKQSESRPCPPGEVIRKSQHIPNNLSVVSFRGSVPSVTCFYCGF